MACKPGFVAAHEMPQEKEKKVTARRIIECYKVGLYSPITYQQYSIGITFL